MSALRIPSLPLRLALTVLVFIACSSLTVWIGAHLEAEPGRSLVESFSLTDFIMRFLAVPALIAAAFFHLAGCSTTGPKTSVNEAVDAPLPSEPFRAKIVGVQWFNPLVWKDYPTEWNLLWALGLVRSNGDDKQARDKPQKYSSVQPVASIVSNIGQRKSVRSVFLQYMRKMLRPFGYRYVTNASYFYTVQPESPRDWRELAGIHVEFAIPDRPELNPDEAAHIVREAIISEFDIGGPPSVSSRNTPPDVRITAGGANAGFSSLAAALDFLETHPDESVWAMSWDAPEFPLDERMSENCTLLVLAGPRFDTGRAPLAWIGRPAVRSIDAFEVRPGKPRLVQAWRAAMEAAAANGGRPLADIGYLIHDAGKAAAVSGKRLGTLGEALVESLPEFDFLEQSFNMPALMGDSGAGTALTNIALAVAYAHHKGRPVLLAGTTGNDTATAVVVTPPAGARVFDPNAAWFRARSESNAYLPWWGLRRDVDGSRYIQGFSE